MMQTSFFDEANDLSHRIEGLVYLPNFIDTAEELALLETIDQQVWCGELKRRVQHYGYRYDYGGKRLSTKSQGERLPDWLQIYCERLYKLGYFSLLPDQVIINEYLPGQGISAHIDHAEAFGEQIASISLGSPTVMEFTKLRSEESIVVLLESRGLLTLAGEARYQWKHAIPARKTDQYQGMKMTRGRRVSMTFRNVI